MKRKQFNPRYCFIKVKYRNRLNGDEQIYRVKSNYPVNIDKINEWVKSQTNLGAIKDGKPVMVQVGSYWLESLDGRIL